MKKPLGLILAALLLIAAAPVAAGALAATLGRPSSRASAAPARLDSHLVEQLAAAKATDQLTVFVHAADVATATKAVKASSLNLIDTFNLVHVAVARGVPAQIRTLANAPGVTFVEADRPITFFSLQDHKATREDEARATIADTAGQPYEGAGVGIAIVDSGIDGTHPMFQEGGKSKVVRNLKLACDGAVSTCNGTPGDANDNVFVDMTAVNDTDSPSLGGHGTHVAGIAAGLDVTTTDGRHLHGTAPKATLVGVSVGQAISVYGGDAGLNWVLEHHDKPCVRADGTAYSDPMTCPPIRVVNNSWGPTGGGTFADASPTTVAIQDKLVQAGVVVNWAAGNGDTTNNGGDGTDSRTNPPGQDPVGGIIMVANYDDGDGSADNQLDPSSSRGMSGHPETYPDLSAPGTNITSACRPYLTVCSTGLDTGDPNYNTISGTSMATPYISGVVASLISAKPAITPAEVELALENSAHKFTAGAPYEADPRNPSNTTSFDKGHGLLDVVGALDTVLGLPFTSPPPAGSPCQPGDPLAVDPTGDAKDFAVAGAFPVSEDALDLVQVDASADADHDLTFTIKVKGLGTDNPATSPNIAFDTYFTFAGRPLFAEASRANDGTLAYKFGTYVDAIAATTRLPGYTAVGSFNPADNTVSVTVPADLLESATTHAPADGGTVSAISTISRRAATNQPVSEGEQADAAEGPCPFTFGATAPVPVPALSAPFPASSEATITTTTPYAWSPGPFTSGRSEVDATDCARDEVSADCDRHGLTVDIPSGGATLTVDVTAQNLVDDFDLTVYKPDGSVLNTSASFLPEEVSEPVSEPGVYTVVVTSFAQDQGGYDATAKLDPPPAPTPPPTPPPADGTVSAGSRYSWNGTTPVPSNPVFTCIGNLAAGVGVGDVFCDIRNVQVDVPSGGGHLTVTATPDVDGDSFEIYIYDPNGQPVKVGSDQSGTGTWTVPVTMSGVYRIGVTSALNLGGYHGVASIA